MQGGKLLTFEETKKYVNNYISQLGVKSKIDIVYKENMVARATTSHDYFNNRSKIFFRKPP